MDQLHICHFAAPKGGYVEPRKSPKLILTSGYELHTAFIAMVWEQSISGEEDENPYTHLQEFEQLCSCLPFAGM